MTDEEILAILKNPLSDAALVRKVKKDCDLRNVHTMSDELYQVLLNG